MKFDIARFRIFCANLRIEARELGLINLSHLLGTQEYVITEIAKGLEDDQHFFVILKGRQLGVSTISLALDLYWLFIHPGLQGSLTTHDEESRDMFRSTLTMYMEGLPKEWKIPLVQNKDRKSTRLNSSHITRSRMPSSA